jgi:single-strand DNA-binding protein
MAADINSVTIVGRMTRDAELKYTNSGFAISSISIAVNRSRKDGDQWVEEANFFDVTLLGRRAESLNQYLQKGTRIAVTGELKQERWEKDGQKRSRVSIQANNIQLLGGDKPQGQSQSNSKTSYDNSNNVNNQKNHENNNAGNGNFEDDIPF